MNALCDVDIQLALKNRFFTSVIFYSVQTRGLKPCSVQRPCALSPASVLLVTLTVWLPDEIIL